MKITVKDAFGTHVGDADVVWMDAGAHPSLDTQSIQENVNLIFEPFTMVILPTKNSQVPWRLEITP